MPLTVSRLGADDNKSRCARMVAECHVLAILLALCASRPLKPHAERARVLEGRLRAHQFRRLDFAGRWLALEVGRPVGTVLWQSTGQRTARRTPDAC
jgi:hypothetical protein